MYGLQTNNRRETLSRLWAMALIQCAGGGGLLSLSGCQPAQHPVMATSRSVKLDHGFYIWQRVWRPALVSALHAVQPHVTNWRVLAFHVDGPVRRCTQVDVAALRDSQKPVHLVVRVEGSQTGVLDDVLIEQIKGVHASWIAQGLPTAGIELDHDVAESQLRLYAAWLSRLRAALPDVNLSITALPAWLNQSEVTALLAIPDEVVLQVHAVNQPAAGLFDARLAQGWISMLAHRHPGPFRVALPCYGSRVVFNEWGQMLAIESETNVAVRSSRERELLASPSEVASLLSWLDAQAPDQMQGLMWFRLPTSEDQRSWRLSTWQALVSGVRSWKSLQAQLAPTPDESLWEIKLINDSELDQVLPLHVDLPAGARAFDGEQGYSVNLLTVTPRLTRKMAAWLRPHAELRIGWLRCEHAPANKRLDIHAT